MKRVEELVTRRLLLRPFRAADLQDLYDCLSDPEVVRFEPYPPATWAKAEAALRELMAGGDMLAVERREDGRVIGNVCLGGREFEALELGYLLRRDCWGRGYALEACRALVEEAFSRGAHRIYAECDPQNAASWRLLERLGFRREAHFRKNVYFWKDAAGCPCWKDTYVYGLLREDAAGLCLEEKFDLEARSQAAEAGPVSGALCEGDM